MPYTTRAKEKKPSPEILTCTMETPLGKMLAAAVAEKAGTTNRNPPVAGLCGLWFIGQKYFPSNSASWITQPGNPVFIKLRAWIDGYFSKQKKLPPLPLSPQGTAFQQKVWKLLSDIPYGTVCTYGGIAEKLAKASGEKNAGQFTRAVAGAIGHNPISLVIPCHRVIGSDGTLKGYAGGIERKQALLELEGTGLT